MEIASSIVRYEWIAIHRNSNRWASRTVVSRYPIKRHRSLKGPQILPTSSYLWRPYREAKIAVRAHGTHAHPRASVSSNRKHVYQRFQQIRDNGPAKCLGDLSGIGPTIECFSTRVIPYAWLLSRDKWLGTCSPISLLTFECLVVDRACKYSKMIIFSTRLVSKSRMTYSSIPNSGILVNSLHREENYSN